MLLPGPPHEIKALFDEQCMDRLRAKLPPQFMATRVLKIAMIAESQADARVAPIYKRYTDVQTTILAGAGEIQLHLKTRARIARGRATASRPAGGRNRRRTRRRVFSDNGDSLEQIVGYYMQMRNATLAVAESCTGGLLAERITSVSGSSRYFLGGAVVYSNQLKTAFADVPADTHRETRRRQPRGCRRAGRRNSQTLRRHAGHRNYRCSRPGWRHARKNRWASSFMPWRLKKEPKLRSETFPATANASAGLPASRRWT